MSWGSILTVFFLSTFKFIFAPFTGELLGLDFWITAMTCFAGGTFSAMLFFFSSEYFIVRSIRNKRKRKEEAIKMGTNWVEKPRFTRTNKLIVRMKRTFGIYGICFWAPFLLSVPIGSIIAAKFYGKSRQSFPLVSLGMAINALFMTTLAYLVF
ncbi:MAG: hypothetical protein ACK45H_15450 [Bacteroidota bacterium]|jgi:hypothetical protein